MGLIREPLDVDFEVDPRSLTKEEKEQITNYIKAYKAKKFKKGSSCEINQKEKGSLGLFFKFSNTRKFKTANCELNTLINNAYYYDRPHKAT